MPVIQTTHGPKDESELEKREGPGWVEYYLDGELVHRSATVQLRGQESVAEQGSFNRNEEK